MKVRYIGQKDSCSVSFPIRLKSKKAKTFHWKKGESVDLPDELAKELLKLDGPESKRKQVASLEKAKDENGKPIVEGDGRFRMVPIYEYIVNPHPNFCEEKKEPKDWEKPKPEKPVEKPLVNSRGKVAKR